MPQADGKTDQSKLFLTGGVSMRKFDTKVQYLKYKVLREVARQEWNGTLQENVLDIPKTIVPGKEATMRCCVYKERAILSERVKLAMGLTMSADPNDKSVIQVIDIACDECPVGGFEVTGHAGAALRTAARTSASGERSALIITRKRISTNQNVWSAACVLRCARTARFRTISARAKIPARSRRFR